MPLALYYYKTLYYFTHDIAATYMLKMLHSHNHPFLCMLIFRFTLFIFLNLVKFYNHHTYTHM